MRAMFLPKRSKKKGSKMITSSSPTNNLDSIYFNNHHSLDLKAVPEKLNNYSADNYKMPKIKRSLPIPREKSPFSSNTL